MTALVSNPIFLLNPVNNTTTGILLNSRSQSSPSHPQDPCQQSSFASSSSPASQTPQSPSLSSNDGEGPYRRIRFAPLPAPRRDEHSTMFYDSDSDSQPSPSRSGSKSFYYPQLPPSPRASSISTLQPDDTPKSKSRTWGQKLLRPLLHPLLPSTSTNGEESYSALFRISSRDSPKVNTDLPSESYKGGAPLTRRMSTGSRAISSTKETEHSHIYRDGVPLMPVMSEGFSSRGRKDGQRMLNGRVYGRRSSPSQNGNQALYEPEFVEWGYGGMGSVVNNQVKSRFGPDWAKLQSKEKVLGGGADVDEEDDGSGMGWVKRRRAQREREEREREVPEEASLDHAVPDMAVYSPQPNESKDYPHPSSRRDDSDQSRDGGEHHVYRAVSIPAFHNHHVRHHSHHRPGDGSGSATPTSMPPLSRANSSSSVPLIRTASSGSQGEILPTMSEKKEDAEISSGSSETGSISIDEDEDGDENNTERESDDDDNDDDAEGRITSRCAGVEKISRHKE